MTEVTVAYLLDQLCECEEFQMLPMFPQKNSLFIRLNRCKTYSIPLFNNDEDYNNVVQALQENSFIRDLSMHGCFTGESRCSRLTKLCNMIKNNSSLTYIGLPFNEFNDDECVLLVNALHGHPTVKEIDLMDNCIGQRGCQALADKVLKCNVALKELILSWNKSIGVNCCKILAEALFDQGIDTGDNIGSSISAANKHKKIETASTTTTKSSSLTRLQLEGCGIDDAGCIELTKMLPRNSTLEHLWIRDNGIGLHGLEALHEAAEQNFTLLSCSTYDICTTIANPGIVLCKKIDLLCRLNRNSSRKKFVDSMTTHQDCVDVLIDTVNSAEEDDPVQGFFMLLSLRPELCDI